MRGVLSRILPSVTTDRKPRPGLKPPGQKDPQRSTRRHDGPKTQTGIETLLTLPCMSTQAEGHDGPKTQTGIETETNSYTGRDAAVTTDRKPRPGLKPGGPRGDNSAGASRRTENPDRD